MKTPTAVLLQFITSTLSTAKQQCRSSGQESHHGLVLLDYVYKSFKADRLAICYSACNVEPACQSLNYDLADKTCDFNSVFKNPEDLTEKPTSVYAVNPHRDPWMKLNAPMSPVCYATKDNQFGRFWIPVSGSLVAVKLVHVSGTVSCAADTANGAYWSFWGCGVYPSPESILTVITNSSDNILFPQSLDELLSFTVPGYHGNSSQLVFPDVQPPFQVSSGQELRVWYSEDWKFEGSHESDNGGLSCFDVYAKII